MRAGTVLRNAGIFVAALVMGTLYAGLIGFIGKATMGYLVAWPCWVVIFCILFYRFGWLRFAGFIAVLPVMILNLRNFRRQAAM